MAEETKEAAEKVVEKENITKVKVKPDDGVYKVDLSKPQTVDEKVEEKPVEEEVVVVNEEPKVEKEEVVEEQKEEQPVLQEITEEELVEEVEEAVTEAETTGKPLPEKIEKLIKFMDETGGDLSDYVNLNRDVSKMDDSDILDEYYRTTKPHLSAEERNFMLEESFGIDEEVDDEKAVRRKKIALKEQVAEAKAHLDRQKSKYYEDIKAGSKLTSEQQKAIDFFNRYNKETQKQNKVTEANKKKFRQRTENVFNKDFKGFDYQVGDKKFRFNVKDINKVKETQSDLNNFVNKFVGENKDTIEDAKGYHKSLFTAMNADAIASHFYEQGKADAIKARIAKDKNINLDPRKTHGETEVGGVKYRVLGETANDFKFKIKKKK
jgi:hypothetical protein|tara:strand:+ start:1104 stop:2240 length:1137 start_codon:yes stop_codon:yes gene_type:complete